MKTRSEGGEIFNKRSIFFKYFQLSSSATFLDLNFCNTIESMAI